MKKLSVLLIVSLFIVGCNCTGHYDKEKQDPKMAYTDDGYYTGCERVKVDGKDYFKCSVHGGFVITPVVK
jgi:hypothetical protein